MNRKSIAIFVCFALLVTSLISPGQSIAKKTTLKLNKKKVTLAVGKSAQLKVKGTKKRAKWKSSNKKIAAVSSKGKVKAKKIGKARITAKIGKKKLVCQVTVKANSSSTQPANDGNTQVNQEPTAGGNESSKPQPTKEPEATATVEPQSTQGPDETVEPQPTKEPDETVEPQPTKEPEATATVKPQPTQEPEATATVKPQPTQGPDETVKPQPTQGPEATATTKPQPTKGSEATATVKPQPTNVGSVSPSPQPSSAAGQTVEPTEKPRIPALSKQASFENGADGFTAKGNADIEVVEGGFTGKCLQVTNRTQASDGVLYEAGEEVTAGESYTVQGYAKLQSGSGTLKVMYRDGDSEENVHELLTVSVSDEWEKFMGTITLPSDCTRLDLWFELSEGTESFYIDEVSITEIVSMKDTYAGIFGEFGTCITPAQLDDPEKLAYVKKHYSSITMENEMKPDAVLSRWGGPFFYTTETARTKTDSYVIPESYKEDQVPELNYDTVDRMLKTARENGLKIRYHVLVWHAQTPEWFFKENYSKDADAAWVSEEKMYARMEMYIRSVMHHVYTVDGGAYRDVVYAWDVANEYFSNDTNPNWSVVFGDREGENGLGNRPTYIKRAFEIAYDMLEEFSLDQSVSLFYNDFNTYLTKDRIIEMIHYINSDRKVCSGVGMQSHLGRATWGDMSWYPSVEWYIETVESFIEEGFEVQVTELDVGCVDTENRPEETLSEAYENQAQYVGELMEKLIALQKASNGAITCLTWWGLCDNESWRKESHVLMFDKNIHDAKPAYFAFMEAAGPIGKPEPEPTAAPTQEPTGIPTAPTPPVPGETPKYLPPVQTALPVAGYDFTNSNNYRNESPNGADFVVNEDGSITITFKNQFAAFNFYLPDNAQNYYSSYKSVVLTYTSEGGNLGHALYDVNMEGPESKNQAAGKHPDWGQQIKESADKDTTVVFNVSEAPSDEENPYIGGCIRGIQIFNPNEMKDGKTIKITVKSLQFCDVENPSEEDLGGSNMEPGTYRFQNDYTYGFSGAITAYKNGRRQNNAEIKVYSGENDDPFTPDTEQPWDAESIRLTRGLSYTTEDGIVHPITSMLTNWNLCADPTSIDNSDVDGRLYVYGTTEGVGYDEDGQMKKNEYANHSLTIMSTKDMVNWTDEGVMDNLNLTNKPADAAGKETCKWAGAQAWAPSGLKIDGDGDGEDEYYLFYTNGGVVGYVQGDSPTGPWKDDLGVPLLTRSTPNCSGVEWCFDPAVLLDDKGDVYVYFGGGIPGTQTAAHPKSGRVVKIKFEPGTGKVLLDGEPKELDTYYFFEDGEINQFHGKYFYSYCTNFDVPGQVKASGALGPIASGQIACYVSNDPMNITFDPDTQQSTDSLKYLGTILSNPSSIYGKSYNNHHHMLSFKGHEYITYHSTALENMLYHTTKDYRCLHVDEIEVDPSTDEIHITPTYQGASQIENFNPYETINATTTSYSAGVRSAKSDAVNAMVLDKIHTGDWTKISGVDFGQKGAASVAAKIASSTDHGAIEVFVDDPTVASNKVASLDVTNTGKEVYEVVQTQMLKEVTGIHDVYFVFRGSNYTVATWEFTANK